MTANTAHTRDTERPPGYPFAPLRWQPAEAERLAAKQGMELGPDHLEMLKALQEYFSKHDKPDGQSRGSLTR